MNTRLTYKTTSSNAEETKNLGEKIGRRLKGGEVFALTGDLGAGKTVFTKGIVEGLGIKEEVSSPSFTLTNVYIGANLTVHHFDFYRIHEAGVLLHELKEILDDKSNVVVIEWPNIIEEKLGDKNISVNINSSGEEVRNLDFTFPESLGYVFEGFDK